MVCKSRRPRRAYQRQRRQQGDRFGVYGLKACLTNGSLERFQVLPESQREEHIGGWIPRPRPAGRKRKDGVSVHPKPGRAHDILYHGYDLVGSSQGGKDGKLLELLQECLDRGCREPHTMEYFQELCIIIIMRHESLAYDPVKSCLHIHKNDAPGQSTRVVVLLEATCGQSNRLYTYASQGPKLQCWLAGGLDRNKLIA